ncbi:proteasome assembly chaperone 4 [Caerostris extrusa]|uniref:Proteasome assembly chaperone 4 n=1 Tax=Caerostris extrusa TaxID=172846 RepID=A0AAV4XHG6_CAEEX|nr:proteasome assembly chaperone 4 [Caerostris extrusa]
MDGELAEPIIKAHTFKENLLDCPVTFHIIKMKDSLFIWIGDQGSFDSLAVAMPTPYDSQPISSTIIGYSADERSCSFASRLSKKIGKHVFASYNLSRNDSNLMVVVTQRLMKEITEHPDKF